MEEYIFIQELTAPVYGKNGSSREISFKVGDVIPAVADKDDNKRVKYVVTEDGNTNHISIPLSYFQKKEKSEDSEKKQDVTFFEKIKNKYSSLTGPQKVGVVGAGALFILISGVTISEMIKKRKA